MGLFPFVVCTPSKIHMETKGPLFLLIRGGPLSIQDSSSTVTMQPWNELDRKKNVKEFRCTIYFLQL